MLSQKEFASRGIVPPVAIKKEHITRYHEIEKNDPYFWLREKDNPEVRNLIDSENKYTESVMADSKLLQETLYSEVLGRIKEDDESVPIKVDNYYYYSRTEKGKSYAIHCRRRESMSNVEEIFFDENELAKDKTFFDCGMLSVSTNHEILAYSTDFSGAEHYTLQFKDLSTGELLQDTYEKVCSFAWRNDNKTFYYVVSDDSDRPYRLYEATLGGEAKLVFEETDERFFLGVTKEKSKKYYYVTSVSKESSEIKIIDDADPNRELRLIQEKKPNVKYSLAEREGTLYMLTDEDAQNGKILTSKTKDFGKGEWTEFVGESENVTLEGFEAFKDFLLVSARENGLGKIWQFNGDTKHEYVFDEPAYSVQESLDPNYASKTFRVVYESFVTPSQVREYDALTREYKVLKENEVKGYNKNLYKSERISAKTEDGVEIPISLYYKKELFKKDGSNPLYLYGYGSYGIVYDARFISSAISLVDRGFVYAIAHIRGGGEMGKKWYESGKRFNKQNTFTDYISCAKKLVEEKYTAPEKLVGYGASAGGLLMGSVANLAPELFRAIIAGVPFVDVANTIMDASLPLTTFEYEEWGNPNEKAVFDYIKSYAPYENVKAQNYPIMLVTAGLNDPRVSYWEPLKWVSKLRDMKTDNNVLILKTNMGAGHQGASGRYEWIKEVAFNYAFILEAIGIIR